MITICHIDVRYHAKNFSGEKCGKRTNCLVYDTDALRLTLGITSSVFMLITVALDAAIWYYIGDLQLYDNEEEADEKGGSDQKKSAKGNNMENDNT